MLLLCDTADMSTSLCAVCRERIRGSDNFLGRAPVDLAEVLRRVGPRAVVALAGQEHAAETARARARVPHRRLCDEQPQSSGL